MLHTVALPTSIRITRNAARTGACSRPVPVHAARITLVNDEVLIRLGFARSVTFCRKVGGVCSLNLMWEDRAHNIVCYTHDGDMIILTSDMGYDLQIKWLTRSISAERLREGQLSLGVF